jgi:phosphatidylglycerophosphatase A
MDRLRTIVVTGFGTGFLPIAPGTWGSAAFCGIFAMLVLATGSNALLLGLVTAGAALACTIACIAMGGFIHRRFGEKDPRACTIDEWAGQAAALTFIPIGTEWTQHAMAISIAFAAFRVFDTIKPPPIRQLEKLPGGLGVVADDLMAGILANITSLLILKLGAGL